MSDVKRARRAELISARARLSPEERSARSLAIADRIEQLPSFRQARTVAVYAPLGSEVDSTEIARRAAARGARVVFPRTVAGERRLAFAPGDPGALVRGPLGALEPGPDTAEVALDEIDCVIVPGVAFSEDGHRLGRGGGYYDATLARMPGATRVAVAFEAQIVAALPREPHDVPIDVLVTEARTLLFAREGRESP